MHVCLRRVCVHVCAHYFRVAILTQAAFLLSCTCCAPLLPSLHRLFAPRDGSFFAPFSSSLSPPLLVAGSHWRPSCSLSFSLSLSHSSSRCSRPGRRPRALLALQPRRRGGCTSLGAPFPFLALQPRRRGRLTRPGGRPFVAVLRNGCRVTALPRYGPSKTPALWRYRIMGLPGPPRYGVMALGHRCS